MTDPSDQQQIRLGKLKKIRELGTEPYPYAFRKTHTIPQTVAQAEELLESRENIFVA